MRLLRKRLLDEKDPEIIRTVSQALNLFEYRVIEEIGALAAVMEGLDGLVFTAGIGEHDSVLRANVCAKLGWLGVKLDAQANARHASIISTAESAVTVRVEPTDEEAVIMRDVLAFMTPQQA